MHLTARTLLLIGAINAYQASYNSGPSHQLAMTSLKKLQKRPSTTSTTTPKPRTLPSRSITSEEPEDMVILPPKPPCCSDAIHTAVCKHIQQRDPGAFLYRCAHEPDFSLVQCCQSCGRDTVDERYELFFPRNESSAHCFDRHSRAFCQRLRRGAGLWQMTNWTCDGDSTPFAFRVCRKTCGFCKARPFDTPAGRFVPAACGVATEFVPT